MAVYTDESEITDYLITGIKSVPAEFTAFINTYLLRADEWYIERTEEMGVELADVVTYASGNMKGSVKKLLRTYVYIEALTDLKSNGIVTTDDYNSKIGGEGSYGEVGYLVDFNSLNSSLTIEKIKGETPAIVDTTSMTGQRVTLEADK